MKRKKLNKNRKVTLTVRQIEQMKSNATKEALEIIIHFPLWVLRTKYGFGKKRTKQFMQHLNDLWDSYNRDYVSLKDIVGALEDEVDVKWEWVDE